MTVQEAFHYISEKLTYASASFYGSPNGLSLGTGLILDGVDYPSYSKDHDGYLTLEGKVWIITHECDIDPSNNRPFNDHALLCPIINFEDFIAAYLAKRSSDKLKAFLSELAAHRLTRVSYIPMITHELPYGGILDFNKISNAHISVFKKDKCKKISAFSDSGQSYIDKILTNHFFRPKSEPLPRGWYQTALSIFRP